MENFVFNSLKLTNDKLNFWNYKNRNEIDFIYEINGEIIGIECKSNLKTDNLTASIKSFIDKFSPNKIYVFNLNIDSIVEYKNCQVIFTSYFNVFNI